MERGRPGTARHRGHRSGRPDRFGHLVVDLNHHEEIANLFIGDYRTELDIDTGGSLKILNMLEDSGAIIVGPVDDGGFDPSLKVYGETHILSGGSISAHGRQSFVDFYRDFVEVAGSLRAEDDATIAFHHAKVWNDHGTIEASHGGLIKFNHGYVQNDVCSTIEARDWHSEIDFRSTHVSNAGRIEAKYGATVDFIRSTIKQGETGLIAAIGCAAAVMLLNSTVSGGAVEARDHGIVTLDNAKITDSTISTQDHGKIETTHGNSTFDGVTVACGSEIQVSASTSLTLQHTIDNKGTIDLAVQQGTFQYAHLLIDGTVHLNGHGVVKLDWTNAGIIGANSDEANTLYNDSNIVGAGFISGNNLKLINESCGVIDATHGGVGPPALVIDTPGLTVINKGLIEATCGGVLVIDSNVDNWHGTIKAAGNSTVYLAANVSGGTIGAYSDGFGPSVVKLFDATIKGATLATDTDGSVIEIVAMNGDDLNKSVFDGSHHHAVTIDGYVLVDAGANLELDGTIHNHGTIEVDGKHTDLVIDGDVTLDGHGTILLDNANRPADQIVGGDDDHNTLHNVNNTIEGAGNIGTGDKHFSLVNESCGTIEANDLGQTLTIDTGRNTITNAGTLAACNGGTLDVESSGQQRGRLDQGV